MMLHWSLPSVSTSNTPHHESDSDSDATIYSPEDAKLQLQVVTVEHHVKNNSVNALAHEDKCKNVNVQGQDEAVESEDGNICIPEVAAQEDISGNFEGNLWQSQTNMSEVDTILLETGIDPTNTWSILEEDFTDFQWYTKTEDCLIESEKHANVPLEEEMFGIKNDIPETYSKISDSIIVEKDIAADEPENFTVLPVDNPLDYIIASMESMSFYADTCHDETFVATLAEVPVEKISEVKQRVSRKRKRSLTRSSPQQKSVKLTMQNKHNGKKHREAIQVAETLLHQLNVLASDPGSVLPWTSQGCRSSPSHQVFSERKAWQPPKKPKRGCGRPRLQNNNRKLEASIQRTQKKMSSYRKCVYSQSKTDQKGISATQELDVHYNFPVAHPHISCDSKSAGIQRNIKTEKKSQIKQHSDSQPYSDSSAYLPDHEYPNAILQTQHTEQNMYEEVKKLTHGLNGNEVKKAKHVEIQKNLPTNSVPEMQQKCYDEGIIIAELNKTQFENIKKHDGINFYASENNVQTITNFPKETVQGTFVTSSEPFSCKKRYVLMELQENDETTLLQELQNDPDNTYFSQAHKNIPVLEELYNDDKIQQTLCEAIPEKNVFDDHKDYVRTTDTGAGIRGASHPKHTDCENVVSESLLYKFNQSISNESKVISSRDHISKIQGIDLQLKSIALPIASEMFDVSHLPLSFWNDPTGPIPEDWIEDLEWKE